MLNRQVGFTMPHPEPTAAEPSEREVRVKLPGAVDQRDGGIKVFAKITEHEGDAAEDIGIFPGNPKCPPGKIDAFATVAGPVCCRTRDVEHLAAMRGQGKSRTVTRIALDRLPKQFQRSPDSSPAPFVVREGAQVEIVRGEVARRSFHR